MMPPVSITYDVGISAYVITDDNTDTRVPGSPSFADLGDAQSWCDENGYVIS